jgi:hypothetical protein
MSHTLKKDIAAENGGYVYYLPDCKKYAAVTIEVKTETNGLLSIVAEARQVGKTGMDVEVGGKPVAAGYSFGDLTHSVIEQMGGIKVAVKQVLDTVLGEPDATVAIETSLRDVIKASAHSTGSFDLSGL